MSGLSVVNVRVVCYGCPGYVLWMSRLCVVNVLVVMKWISVGILKVPSDELIDAFVTPLFVIGQRLNMAL